MPRGPVVFTLPPGTTPQSPGDVIQSAVWNAAMDDISQTFNTIQPKEYGGTGSSDLSLNATDLRVKDGTDTTKRIAFNASSITTATTRTITMGDADVTLRPQSWELISSALYGSVTTIDFTDLGAYRYLRLSGRFIPATSGANVLFNVSTNNGASFVTTAGTYGMQTLLTDGATSSSNRNTTATGINLGSADNSTGNFVNMTISNFANLSVMIAKGETSAYNSGGNPLLWSFNGYFNQIILRNAFRLSLTSGSFNSAHVVLEGIRN